MGIRKAIAAALVAAGVAGAAPAIAQSSGAGLYLGGSLGQSDFAGACDDVSGPGVSCEDNDTAWKIFGGYQVNRNFALEVGYTDLGELEASGPGGTVTLGATAWELVGLGILPLGNRFSLLGKAGLYNGEVEMDANTVLFTGNASESNTGLTYGVGAQIDATANVALRFEWQRYSDMGGSETGEGDIDVIGVSAQFRF